MVFLLLEILDQLSSAGLPGFQESTEKEIPSFEAAQTHKNNMIKGIPRDLLTYIYIYTQLYTYSYTLHIFAIANAQDTYSTCGTAGYY